MLVKYRQRNNYGCISFALANIFDEHRFLENLPTDGPVRMADVRGKMVEFLPEIFIQEMFVTSHKLDTGGRLHVSQRDILRPDITQDLGNVPRETIAIPFILTIINRAGNQHAVGFIWDLETDLYHFIDSTEEEIIVDSLWFFVAKYHIVGVYQFAAWEADDSGVMLSKEYLSHIFPPDK